MTRSCSALGCTARDTGRSRERGISFHQFPADAAQRRQWIRAVNRVDPRSHRAWRPGPGAILCSRHFAEGDFERYGLRRKLRRGAVPSQVRHSGVIAEPYTSHQKHAGWSCSRGHAVALYSAVYLCYVSLI
uniref:THAP domain-containing protein 1 n=1 Tax=Corvus moneduloides TaxID=1196302 RepID=A0A8U7MD23_CORMO